MRTSPVSNCCVTAGNRPFASRLNRSATRGSRSEGVRGLPDMRSFCRCGGQVAAPPSTSQAEHMTNRESTGTTLAQRERHALADLFNAVGPDAPTLCAGWSTRDLAAHLVLREGHPAAVGIAIRPFASWTSHTQASLSHGDY